MAGKPAQAGADRKPVVNEGQPEMVSPARRAAFQVLLQVGAGRGHSDELLHASGRGLRSKVLARRIAI